MGLSPPEQKDTSGRHGGISGSTEETGFSSAALGRPSSSLRVTVIAVSGVLAAVLVAALLVGGGAPAPSPGGLPDAGPVTGWGLPLASLSTRLLAVLTVGQLVFVVLLATPSSTGAVRALHATSWTAAGWLVAELVCLVLTASTVLGVPVAQLSAGAVVALAVELPVGSATLWVALPLVVVVAASSLLARRPVRRRRAVSGPLLVLALCAVVVPGVLAGHSAAAGSHVAAVITLSAHVVSATLWVGGLAALLLHGRSRFESAQAVRRFSGLALACLALLLLSGVVAALVVAGAPSWSWVGEGWIHLLAVKVALVVVLGLIGWQHRRVTIPALEAGRPWTFVRLGAVEVALMALTLTVSVALASSPAPTPAAGAPVAAVPAASEVEEPTGPSAATQDVEAPRTQDRPAAERPSADSSVAEMSGHDHGELSVGILIDDERFHVAGTVRPGQPVTVYNSSDIAASITSPDFDVDVPPRTFKTFPAPSVEGDYGFVSQAEGQAVDGFADILRVRADS